MQDTLICSHSAYTTAGKLEMTVGLLSHNSRVYIALSAFHAISFGCSLMVGSTPTGQDTSFPDDSDPDGLDLENELLHDSQDSGPSDDVTDIFPEDFLLDSNDTTEVDAECLPGLEGECNLVNGCGCSESSSCRLMLDESHCRLGETCGTRGSLPTGSECTPESDACAEGLACFPERLTGIYRCHRWCFHEAHCDPGFSCDISPTIFSDECGSLETDPYKLCRLPCPLDAACDPFTGTVCTEPNNACTFDETCGILFCRPSGSYMEGEICSGLNDCESGLHCISTDGGLSSRCHAFCDENHACTSGSCTTFDPGYSANPTLGVCTPR